MKEVQMRVDNYDITHNPQVREKYPNLYKEVLEHDELVPRNSWYSLSEEAFKEYELYSDDDSIDYIK